MKKEYIFPEVSILQFALAEPISAVQWGTSGEDNPDNDTLA